MDLLALLQQVGLSSVQAEVFIHLYTYGAKPASSLASTVGMERTNMYKSLQGMVAKGLLAETTKAGVRHFFVPNQDILLHKLEEQKKELAQKEQLLSLVQVSLQKLDTQRLSPLPTMRFFEGKQGIEHVFDDIQTYVEKNNYLVVKLFAANTLESQSASLCNLHDYGHIFFQKLAQNGVRVEGYLGNGILLLESVLKTYNIDELAKLPAGNATVNIFVVGSKVWIIVFKQTPFGIAIESEELADVIHFLLKQAIK